MTEKINSHIPLVSIGMFVYNGESCIRDSIESILSQSYKDFEFIISDNASTDDTQNICKEYAKKDSRIRYIRQSKNIGATANCLFVLDEAIGEYFIWAAHDDIKSENFLEVNLKFLQKNPDYIASTSPVKFKDGMPDPVKMGDQSLNQETAQERFFDCINAWTGCGRFYSLIRRSALIDNVTLRRGAYLGQDIAVILELAIKGKLNRTSEGYVALGRNGLSGSQTIYRTYRNSLLNWFIPLHEFNVQIWSFSSSFSFKNKAQLAITMLKMNLISSLHQIKTELKLLLAEKLN
ncbi:glycosyl transferase [Methylophilaceae bacterium 11]|uniref:glycosyltransferase family 2 protein n=1 Tax=Methylotenera sp. 1P/1 TaxID=1131551 RepID=UPI00036940BF|nr:glycosyltransferase family 2 protein [Methylotenera sp. 1P/1]EUJ10040.1 glycosyl transferase [Methylophilaceae bacterium 11]